MCFDSRYKNLIHILYDTHIIRSHKLPAELKLISDSISLLDPYFMSDLVPFFLLFLFLFVTIIIVDGIHYDIVFIALNITK